MPRCCRGVWMGVCVHTCVCVCASVCVSWDVGQALCVSAPASDPASALWVLVCRPNASFLLCITVSPCSFFLTSLLEGTLLSVSFWLACRTFLPSATMMSLLSLVEEILFWWSPQILNMFWFISLTAPHYLPLALPRMEFIRPTALLLQELIFPNMTESDMQLTPSGLGYKPGLSYMTTFILHHYPSPLAVWWGPLFSVSPTF